MKHFNSLLKALLLMIGFFDLQFSNAYIIADIRRLIIAKETEITGNPSNPVTSYQAELELEKTNEEITEIILSISPTGSKSAVPSQRNLSLKNEQKNKKRYVSGIYNFDGKESQGMTYMVTLRNLNKNGNVIGSVETYWTTFTCTGSNNNKTCSSLELLAYTHPEKSNSPCDKPLYLKNMIIESCDNGKDEQEITLDIQIGSTSANANEDFFRLIQWNYGVMILKNNVDGTIERENMKPTYDAKSLFNVKFHKKRKHFHKSNNNNTPNLQEWSIMGIQFGVKDACDNEYSVFDGVVYDTYDKCDRIIITDSASGKDDPQLTAGAIDSFICPTPDSLYAGPMTFDRIGNHSMPLQLRNLFVQPVLYGDPFVNVTFTSEAMDAKGNLSISKGSISYNTKTGFYEGMAVFEKLDPKTIEVISLNVNIEYGKGYIHRYTAQLKPGLTSWKGMVIECNEIIIGAKKTGPGTHSCNCTPNLKSIQNNDQTNSKDSCHLGYDVKTVQFKTGTQSGLYTFQFDLKVLNNSPAASEVYVVAVLTNCGGETVSIRVPLSLDSSSNEYVGAKAIRQDAQCPYEFTHGIVVVVNPCGEAVRWKFSGSLEKANGKGTRNTAASAGNTSSAQLL